MLTGRRQKRHDNQQLQKNSGTRNLEAECTRSRADSTGGCVKPTVAEIRRSSAYGTFVVESVYLILNSVSRSVSRLNNRLIN